MTPQERIETAQAILRNKRSINAEKQQVNEEIKSIEMTIEAAIDEEDTAVNLKGELHEKKLKISYRKKLNAKIKGCEKALDECLEGKGDYDKDQLTFLSLEQAKKEQEESEKSGEQEEESDEDFFDGVEK